MGLSLSLSLVNVPFEEWDGETEEGYHLVGYAAAEVFEGILRGWVDGLGSSCLVRETPAQEKAAPLTRKGSQFYFVVEDGGKEMLDVVTGICEDVFVALPAAWLRDELWNWTFRQGRR